MELTDAVRDETLDLADRLSALTDEQWNSRSLCAEWRIRDVLAHVTAGAQGAFGVGAVVGGMLRNGLNYNRWVAADAKGRGEQDPAVILAALRDTTAHPTGRPVRALMHVLIHGQDICRPLGITRDLPESRLIPVADFVKRDTFIFGTKKRISGLKLIATDMDWAHGDGPEVAGPAEALVMTMAGRPVALRDLSGEGVAALSARP